MRQLLVEVLEHRCMLTPVAECGDGSGSLGPIAYDVNLDEYITPADVLPIIRYLNADEAEYRGSYDVNCDGLVTPLDVLGLVNHINKFGPSSQAAFVAWTVVSVPTTWDISHRAWLGDLQYRVGGNRSTEVTVELIFRVGSDYAPSVLPQELTGPGGVLSLVRSSYAAGGSVLIHTMSGRLTGGGVVGLYADTSQLNPGTMLSVTMIRTEWSAEHRSPAASGLSW